MQENELTMKELRTRRMQYGISQNELAMACGITRTYLNRLENGSKNPSNKLLEKLSTQLNCLGPDLPLSLLYDYVRIRFSTTDVKRVIEGILHLNFEYMIHEDRGLYSYQERYFMGDIIVLASSDVQKGVLLELKGRGCRQMEFFLSAQKRTWSTFFSSCFAIGGIIKRLDLAINDYAGLLDIPELALKCERGECVTLFNSFKGCRSGKLVHRSEKDDMGETLYLGSFNSDIYFCVYQKDYEQFVKLGIPMDETRIKNRFEIRVKNEKGNQMLHELIHSTDIEKTIFSWINRYIRFVEPVENKVPTKWPLTYSWRQFIGYNREKMQLITEPKPYTIERTLKWLEHQVAPSMKLVFELGEFQPINYAEEMIKNATLTEKYQKILKQLSTPIEKLIV